MQIELKNGTIYTFSSIEKGEYHKLYDFVTDKKLRIKNRNKVVSLPVFFFYETWILNLVNFRMLVNVTMRLVIATQKRRITT